MAERRDTYAYFWVEGFDCAPEEISKRLGISPTEIKVKGEAISINRERKMSIWSVHSPLARGDAVLDSYLVALLGVLEPCATAIHDVSQDYEIGISCVGYYYSANPGFHLSSNLIQRLSALGVSVDFDLYCYCSSCDVAEPK